MAEPPEPFAEEQPGMVNRGAQSFIHIIQKQFAPMVPVIREARGPGILEKIR